MLNTKTQKIVDRVVTARIAVLAELIRADIEPNASIAAEQLTFIGTRESNDALMELFRETKDETLALMIIGTPFRNDYREAIENALGKELVAEAYADIMNVDQRLISPPLWQTIAEELDAEFAREPGSWHPKPINWPE